MNGVVNICRELDAACGEIAPSRRCKTCPLSSPAVAVVGEPIKRYLNDVLTSGTANERTVARTALALFAAPPDAALDAPKVCRMLTMDEIGDCECDTIERTAHATQSKFAEVNNLTIAAQKDGA